jgi:CopG family transcriptional regulator, nickel-responsive regulator
MKPTLVRFGVAIDAPLLSELDVLVGERGCTRSELFRDLARAEIGRAKIPRGVDAVGALTLVYDHHVRDLSEKLTELQHELGENVRATMHVHLSHDLCMEVIVVRGRSDRLKAIAERMLAMRGVKHGGIEIVADALGREQLGGAEDEAEKEAEPAGRPRPPRRGAAARGGKKKTGAAARSSSKVHRHRHGEPGHGGPRHEHH